MQKFQKIEMGERVNKNGATIIPQLFDSKLNPSPELHPQAEPQQNEWNVNQTEAKRNKFPESLQTKPFKYAEFRR